jgi:hypothetical protein
MERFTERVVGVFKKNTAPSLEESPAGAAVDSGDFTVDDTDLT